MKELTTKLPCKKGKPTQKGWTMLFVQFLLLTLSSMPAWPDDEHHHEHESSEQHAPHHENGDHRKHEDHDEHEHEDHDEHGLSDENSSRIDDEMASQVGIVTSIAGTQELHQTISVFGSIISTPEQLSHVRARFEGLVKAVKVTLGDRVRTGDVLAEIESNDSLNTYTIKSPISGRVVQRHANTGEVTRDQVLFSIANFDTVWAELRVYPAQQFLVSEGQPIFIITGNSTVSSTVDHILPSIDFPYQIARVKLENESGSLPPGSMMEASIEVGRFSVALAVVKNAVQTLGGRQGVFVKQGEEYKFTPLVLGRSDDHFYEVIDGLVPGSEYVSENSYLIKADIEKSEAEHEH